MLHDPILPPVANMADRLLASRNRDNRNNARVLLSHKRQKTKQNNLISDTYPSLTVLCLCPAVHRSTVNLKLCGCLRTEVESWSRANNLTPNKQLTSR